MIKRLVITACMTLFFLVDPCRAAEYDFDRTALSAQVSLASRYLFQGIDYSDSHPVLQPEFTVERAGGSLTGWANFDLHERHVNELDGLLAYTWEGESLSLTPGYAYYHYPNRSWGSSQEVYLDISYATLLAVSLSAHYDFDEGDGAYATLGISHSIGGPSGTLEVGSNLFYQRNYYDQTGIPSLEFSAQYQVIVHGYHVSSSVSYFATWENGDFHDDGAVPSRWAAVLTVGSGP